MDPKYPNIEVQLTGEDGFSEELALRLRPRRNSYFLEHIGRVRVCTRCSLLLEAKNFSPHGGGRLTARCKPCTALEARVRYARDPETMAARARERRLSNPQLIREIDRRHHFKVSYGITVEQFDSLLLEQGGVCAVCHTNKPKGPGQRFCVDHDHATGIVRGILCMPCNTALGLFKDDPVRLASALIYLERDAFRQGRVSREEFDEYCCEIQAIPRLVTVS